MVISEGFKYRSLLIEHAQYLVWSVKCGSYYDFATNHAYDVVRLHDVVRSNHDVVRYCGL